MTRRRMLDTLGGIEYIFGDSAAYADAVEYGEHGRVSFGEGIRDVLLSRYPL